MPSDFENGTKKTIDTSLKAEKITADVLKTALHEFMPGKAEKKGRMTYKQLQETSVSKLDSMVIGTSAIIDTEIDGAVGMYSGIFNNPFMIWGRYRLDGDKALLPISFQFHHTQMDGAHAGAFLRNLEEEISKF